MRDLHCVAEKRRNVNDAALRYAYLTLRYVRSVNQPLCKVSRGRSHIVSFLFFKLICVLQSVIIVIVYNYCY